MLPIKLVNGVASIAVNATRTLTKRQLATFQRTKSVRGEASAERYLHSLLGLIRERVEVRRLAVNRHAEDRLAVKPKGTVSAMFRDLQTNDEDAMHKPTKRSPGAWVGVEIECYYPVDKHCTDDCDHDNGDCYADSSPSEDTCRKRIRQALVQAGVTRASVKDDGSLEDEEGAPVEVTLLFNTDDGFGQLEKVCRVLSDLGCYVNDKCGLHVHLDARHLKPRGARLLARRLGRALPVLKWIVDPSRHDNHYCKLDVGPFGRSHVNRYFAVNTQAYFHYKTLEVRMHGGSTNFKKIKHWIELLRFIASARMPKPLATFQDLIDLGIPEYLVEYADRRINRLNPNAWSILMPKPAPAPMPLIEIKGIPAREIGPGENIFQHDEAINE